MSFWDKVQSVALAAKCFSGWHAGKYTPIADEPKCHLEKVCPDCRKYLTKISTWPVNGLLSFLIIDIFK